jgi:hypothetical protein
LASPDAEPRGEVAGNALSKDNRAAVEIEAQNQLTARGETVALPSAYRAAIQVHVFISSDIFAASASPADVHAEARGGRR